MSTTDVWENPYAQDIDKLKILEKKKIEEEEKRHRKSNVSCISLVLVVGILFLISTCCVVGGAYLANIPADYTPDLIITATPSPQPAMEPSSDTLVVSMAESQLNPSLITISSASAVYWSNGVRSETVLSNCTNRNYCHLQWGTLEEVTITLCVKPLRAEYGESYCRTRQINRNESKVTFYLDG